jgi:hypothetical protein
MHRSPTPLILSQPWQTYIVLFALCRNSAPTSYLIWRISEGQTCNFAMVPDFTSVRAEIKSYTGERYGLQKCVSQEVLKNLSCGVWACRQKVGDRHLKFCIGPTSKETTDIQTLYLKMMGALYIFTHYLPDGNRVLIGLTRQQCVYEKSQSNAGFAVFSLLHSLILEAPSSSSTMAVMQGKPRGWKPVTQTAGSHQKGRTKTWEELECE